MSTINGRHGAALYYATRDGQSQRIAEHIFRRLNDGDTFSTPRDLAVAQLRRSPSRAAASVIVLVAAVRYGRHLPEADRFLAPIARCRAAPARARIGQSHGPQAGEDDPNRQSLFAQDDCAPSPDADAWPSPLPAGSITDAIVGCDRQIIRFIMLLTGGPTDPATSIEYTSWRAVDDFADRIAALRRRV